MRFRKFTIGLLIAGIAAPAAAADEQPLHKRLDTIAARFAKMPITGMTIAVSRNGKLLESRGYGLADIAAKRPAGPDTVYEIGSTTKQFTAAAILRLVEQGRLDLDDEVATYFPALAGKAGGATIRHLLGHSSGLFSGRSVEDLTAATDPKAVVSLLSSRDTEFAPGTRFRYNNNGYILLGLLIEQLSGVSYPDYLEREFFRPLNLRSTSICSPERGPEVATGYEHPANGPSTPRPFERHHPMTSYSAGAICSTAGDLLTWQDALVSGRVVSDASFKAMSSPQQLQSGRASPYGLGMFGDNASGEPHLHHGGASSGFITQLGYFPADRTGVVVLTNGIYSGAIAEQIERAVLLASRGLEDKPPVRLPLRPEEHGRYTGTYDLGPVQIEVYSQGDYLRAQPPGQVAARLLYQGGGKFIAEHDPRISFDFGPGAGMASELILSQSGRAMPPAKRVRK